ncbi:DUF1802 family protein [Lyngbya sp. CCY1209]|uniref:DUF1802 family protein n=1 Tax=Lyngbya sp. CCY1209 TaxID=2886103 RepID=UPI002D20481C|nr:DUF1802 family protein [Lyngbya sp. CCY1209]MEB3885656.1 DUF1802 family protein [Lyngbya sp. CCY1209]
MSNAMMIDTALRLPAPEVEALISGRSLVAMPLQFIEVGEYALCPDRPLIPTSSPSHYYKPDFLDLANTPAKPQVKAWAKCDRCELIDETESLEKLSDLTLWTPATLREIIAERELIFLAYFRVYLLPEPLEVEAIDPEDEFIPLLSPISITTANPVFDDDSFRDRSERLVQRHLIASVPDPVDQEIDIAASMMEISASPPARSDSDLEWIQTIADVGNSSDGHAFEKLVRKSFIKLGFTNSNTDPKMSLDPEATGGAGGLDLYCEEPYSVIGECKATKNEKVSDGTPSQLIKLGYKFFSKEKYDNSIKIIFAGGKLTKDANQTAEGNRINVIRPETLQQLIEIAENYPDSIDLSRLKECLENGDFGEAADTKLSQFIEKVNGDILELSSPPETADRETEIQQILMRISAQQQLRSDPDLEWIQTIADVGNSSDGYTFEKLVRKSFIKLGFTNSSTDPKMSLDPEATGGAGGLDLYCEKPYPVVGECKATKTENVPDGTPAQLIKHGNNFLGKEGYENAVKIILAAGKLNSFARRTAEGNQMNVIRPETLQQLMEMAAKYPGSINLCQLKECLEKGNFGEAADDKVLEFIGDIKKEIKLRSHLVCICKEHDLKPEKPENIDYIKGSCGSPDNPEELKKKSKDELREILIELSSPLTGYLGRIKEEGSDEYQFYFIREMPEIDSQSS